MPLEKSAQPGSRGFGRGQARQIGQIEGKKLGQESRARRVRSRARPRAQKVQNVGGLGSLEQVVFLVEGEGKPRAAHGFAQFVAFGIGEGQP